MRRNFFIIILVAFTFQVFAQIRISGSVLNEKSRQPIEFVNIGIVGKNIGTVSDRNGNFSLLIDVQHANDSLLFSYIGFESRSVRISEMRENGIITLSEKSQLLDEVVVVPRNFRERTFGTTTSSRRIQAGFSQNLGYEAGLLIRNRGVALLKSVRANIASLASGIIFYRLNVYEERGRRNFVNILTEPIYIITSREEILKNGLQIDLADKNIVVNGNFLVTLERISDLGDCILFFPASFRQRTYFRKTSQGSWEAGPIGIALSVTALVER